MKQHTRRIDFDDSILVSLVVVGICGLRFDWSDSQPSVCKVPIGTDQRR